MNLQMCKIPRGEDLAVRLNRIYNDNVHGLNVRQMEHFPHPVFLLIVTKSF